MIFNFLINFVILLFGAVFDVLPHVRTIPVILGVDIDSVLVNGVGYINGFVTPIWPLRYMLDGAFVILFYHALKLSLQVMLGSRAPH
jgi:hypothetical protein